MLPLNRPTPALKPFVAGYACIDVPLLPGQRHQARATPLACPAILLLDQGDIRITDGPAAGQRTPPATFVGQLTRSGGHDYTGPIHGFLIQLAPAGGHDLLGCAMPRFANASVPMQQALPPELAGSLENVVHASTDFAARCAAADAVLLAWARQRRARPGLGAAAAELLMNSQGQLEIEEVAARLDVSARTLLRLFTRQVGMSPKNFARPMPCANSATPTSRTSSATTATLPAKRRATTSTKAGPSTACCASWIIRHCERSSRCRFFTIPDGICFSNCAGIARA